MGDMEVTRFGGPAVQGEAVGVKQRSRTRELSVSLSTLTTQLPPHAKHGKRGRMKGRTELAIRMTNTGSLSGLYAMLIASMAIVLTLAHVLSRIEPTSSGGTVLFVFHMYVYVAAFVFLVYLECCIRKFKLQHKQSDVNDNPCIRSRSPPTASGHNSEIFLINPDNNRKEGELPDLTEAHVKEAEGDQDSINYEAVCAQLLRFPAFQFNGEGVNLFARMGLIAFGLAAVLLDGFRLLMTAEAPNAYNCYGLISILPIAARMLFTFLQIFSLFKNHEVLINYRHVLMRFGLLHVAAANLCTWVYTLVLEAQQAFTSSGHSAKVNATHHNVSYHSPSHNKDMVLISHCYRRTALYDVASPYLYPFTIEFSLLAAAMFYKLYSTIGHTTVCPAKEEEEDKELPDTEDGHCDKANSGLFLGLAVFISAGLAMCLFIYLLSKSGMSDTTFMIYLISDILTNSLSLIAIIPSFYQFSKLRFTGILEDVFDQNLLIIALGGVYILLGFLGFAAASRVHHSGIQGTFAILQLSSALLTFIQGTLQAVFIVDALRRQVKEPEHHHTKPGRSCVTFLLIANLAMWLINTFQLKEVHHAEMFTSVYGKLAWTIIMHIFLPLAVFFRFHASVALSDIWQKTYDTHHVHTVHMLSLQPNKEH